MKKPSFAIYALGYAACMLGCFFGILAGIRYYVPVLLVLAGEAAVWSSMIFDNYHKRLKVFMDYQRDMIKFDHFMATACRPGVAPDQEVQQDV